jgi:GTP cyclohydrolase I
VARFWKEFLDYDPGTIDVTFESTSIDQMIVVKGIRVYSLCEHHLLPITCDVSIGYISVGRVLGLSKLARIAHKHAHKLQLQERMTQEIANEVCAATGVLDVAVVVEGVHMCMIMRGIRTPGKMITSEMRGRFRDPGRARIEFLQLIRGG